MILRGISFLFISIFLFAHDSPYSLVKFKDVLNSAKLQAPVSAYNPLYSRKYGDFENYSNKYFYLQDNKYMVFYMCGFHHRSELRFRNDWSVNTDKAKILEAEVKLLPLNSQKEFTFLQIHADDTIENESILNKPLLRVVWLKYYHHKYNHIWAVIRLNTNRVYGKYLKVDLGKMPKTFFIVKIYVKNNNLKIYFNNIKKVDMDVGYWQKYKNYFKLGVYLQNNGCAKAIFNKIEIKD